jgi:hypothetical protein
MCRRIPGTRSKSRSDSNFGRRKSRHPKANHEKHQWARSLQPAEANAAAALALKYPPSCVSGHDRVFGTATYECISRGLCLNSLIHPSPRIFHCTLNEVRWPRKKTNDFFKLRLEAVHSPINLSNRKSGRYESY